MKLVCVTLVLFLLAAGVPARRDSPRERDERGRTRSGEAFRDLEPRKPQEVFSSDGGKIEAYDAQDYRALCDAEFGAKRVTIEPNGLVLPSYADSHVLLTVLEGRLRAGIVSPFTDKVTERSVFHLRRGDTLAIPRGFTVWFYNDGERRARYLAVADTSSSNQCGHFESFYLAGRAEERSGSRTRSQEHGTSLLNGFSKALLAHAWGVDESTVQRVSEGQRGSVIVRVNEQHRRELPEVTANGMYIDFVYRGSEAQPDVNVPRGGEMRQLNSLKMTILKHMGLSGSCFKLKPGALTAPSWTHNAPKLIYVSRGRGRAEVVRENGEQAVSAEMEEGDLLVIPANFPSAKVASDEDFEYGVVYKTHLPVESFLAGRNSAYKGIPGSVVSSSLQIDEKLQEKLEERRSEEAYIFPSRREPRKDRGEEGFHLVETLVRVFG